MANPASRTDQNRPIQTNWYILTGAPCSGKTAVINELARRGYGVVHEAARAHVEAKLARGLPLADIRGNPSAFEHLILEKKIAIERRLDPRKKIFFDRGVADSIAYFRLSGLDTSEPVARSRRMRYRKVFLLDRLATRKDAVRMENEQAAEQIETLLVACYQELGYPLIRIPVLDICRRTDRILEHLQ